jgi:hypothetical protein
MMLLQVILENYFQDCAWQWIHGWPVHKADNLTTIVLQTYGPPQPVAVK